MKVEIVDKQGRIKTLPKRHADLLVKLKRAQFVEGGYYNRAMVSQPNLPIITPAAPLVSDAVIQFAAENNVNILLVVGTGANGRINKKDVETYIQEKSKQE